MDDFRVAIELIHFVEIYTDSGQRAQTCILTSPTCAVPYY